MEKFVLQKLESGRYRNIQGINSVRSELLYDLLRTDASLSNAIKNYRAWVEHGQAHDAFCANATCVSFKDQDTILLEAGYEVDEKYQYYTELPKTTFLHLLDEWEKVLINKPDKVVITINDDKSMTFEQIFEEDKEFP